MSNKGTVFLKNILGDSFLETLEKTELYKQGTRTTVDPEEIRLALKVVPKTIMSLLIKELVPMQIGESKDISLFVGNQAMLHVDKTEKDCYNGEIIEDNKKVASFYSRSIPGVGLYILSTFELYDMYSEDKEEKYDNQDETEAKVQKMIDDRLMLRDLVSQVVEKKMAEKEALEKLIAHKITDLLEYEKMKHKITQAQSVAQAVPHLEIPKSVEVTKAMVDKEEPSFVKAEVKKIKGSPVVDFVTKRKNKSKEFHVEMAKGEKVNCPDCRKEVFNDTGFSGCICLGDDRASKITINKSEDGIKLAFSKDWDQENIELLLEILRNKNG